MKSPVVLVSVFAAAQLCAAQPGAGEAKVAFAPNIQPAPVSMTFESNTVVRLDRDCVLTIQCADGDADAVEWAEDHLALWFRFTKKGFFSSAVTPSVKAAAFTGAPVSGGDEAYELESRPGAVTVRANTMKGVRYALFSLRQTVMAAPRNVRRTEYYVMPALKIKDAPALAFRGIHLPWGITPQTPESIEKHVRLAAALRYNYAVIEPWGSFRSERLPWWGWKEGTMTPDAVRRIVKVGKDLGITLIPQIPAFGHASMGITSPGRHAILDAHGEYAPLFESLNGWNWCLSNPETLKVQFELIDEMMELFGNPPFFHVGCDEAAKPNCPLCLASDYRQLVVRHILALHEGLKKRGARMMLWHDMFLKEGDPRWKGLYANGTDETVAAFEKFPRDIMVCDWFYEGKRESYPSLEHFKNMGFDVVTCPWHKLGGTFAQANAARRLGLSGMLVTTWGHGSGKERGRVRANVICGGASACWGTDYRRSDLWKWDYDLDFIRNMRDAVHDMYLTDYAETGTYRE